jgi:hypothetical protein
MSNSDFPHVFTPRGVIFRKKIFEKFFTWPSYCIVAPKLENKLQFCKTKFNIVKKFLPLLVSKLGLVEPRKHFRFGGGGMESSSSALVIGPLSESAEDISVTYPTLSTRGVLKAFVVVDRELLVGIFLSGATPLFVETIGK